MCLYIELHCITKAQQLMYKLCKYTKVVLDYRVYMHAHVLHTCMYMHVHACNYDILVQLCVHSSICVCFNKAEYRELASFINTTHHVWIKTNSKSLCHISSYTGHPSILHAHSKAKKLKLESLKQLWVPGVNCTPWLTNILGQIMSKQIFPGGIFNHNLSELVVTR